MPRVIDRAEPRRRFRFAYHLISVADDLFSSQIASILRKLVLGTILKFCRNQVYPRSSTILKNSAAGEFENSIVLFSFRANQDDAQKKEQVLIQSDPALKILSKNENLTVVVLDDEEAGDWSQDLHPSLRRKMISYAKLPSFKAAFIAVIFALAFATVIYSWSDVDSLCDFLLVALNTLIALFVPVFVLKGIETRAVENQRQTTDALTIAQIGELRFRVTALIRVISEPIVLNESNVLYVSEGDDSHAVNEGEDDCEQADTDWARDPHVQRLISHWVDEKKEIQMHLELAKSATDSSTLWEEIDTLKKTLDKKWNRYDR